MANHPNRSSNAKIAAAHNVRFARRHNGFSLHGFLSDCEAAAREINERAAGHARGKYFVERADTGLYLSR